MSTLGKRWDWRHWTVAFVALILCCTLVALLGVAVVNAIQGRRDAVASLAGARRTFTQQVTALRHEDTRAVRQTAILATEVNVLRRQLKLLGVTPAAPPARVTVIRRSSTTTTTSTPARHRHRVHRTRHHHRRGHTPNQSPRPTPRPRPRPTPSPCLPVQRPKPLPCPPTPPRVIR